MTDDTVTPVDNDVDLEQFEAEWNGTANAVVDDDPAPEDEVDDLGEDDENDPPASDEDDASDEEDAEPEDSDEEDEEEEPAPKKNKVSAKERIEQLNTRLRETERKYEDRIKALEAVINEKAKEDQTPLREQLPEKAPDPDALLEDGTPKYPMGEYDPQYIRDLTDFSVEQKLKIAEQERAQREQQAAFEQEKAALQQSWVENLDRAEAEIPEIREDIRGLTDEFASLEPGYGEYLAMTIMSSEVGPEIMHYLSQNIGEAQKIVASGPAAATFALGRIEAMLSKPKQTERKEKKVSKAPPPPEDRARGTNGKFRVADDTDDLDAFEKAFNAL